MSFRHFCNVNRTGKNIVQSFQAKNLLLTISRRAKIASREIIVERFAASKFKNSFPPHKIEFPQP